MAETQQQNLVATFLSKVRSLSHLLINKITGDIYSSDDDDDDDDDDSITDEIVDLKIMPDEIGDIYPAELIGEYSQFQIDISAMFIPRQPTEIERRVLVSGTFPLPLYTLSSDRAEAHSIVYGMLIGLGVQAGQPGAPAAVDAVLDCCCRMAIGEAVRGRYLRVLVDIDLVVDQFPELDDEDFDTECEVDFYEDDDDDDDVPFERNSRFVPASEEAIADLEKVTVEVSEKQCSFCLDNVSVGSEAIRLPCSHHYHEDCILLWLSRSNLCPLCRYCLS